MGDLHSLLSRQLKRHGVAPETCPTQVQQLISEVNQAYFQFDADRTMLERSLDLSSQELVQANSEMRAIFQALPDLYFLLDEEGTILDCKGGQDSDFLMSPRKLVGKKVQDIPIDDIGSGFQRAIDVVSSRREIVNFEYSVGAKPKQYYEARIVPLHEKHIVAVVRNITSAKQAEMEVVAQRAFLRQVIDLTPNFIFAKDRQGRFTLVNKAVAEAYGTSVEQLLGKSDADFNPNAEEVEHFRRDDLEVMELKQEKFISEEVITDASGNTRWLQTIKRPIVTEDGRADQVLGASTDITERKRREGEVERSLSLVRATLESTADGILVVDSHGTITSNNKKFAEMWRIPDNIMQSGDDARLLEFVLEQLAKPEEFLNKVRELYANPHEQSYDVLEFRDGRIFERYSQSQTIGGKSVGRVWSFRDVSEQKRLEQQLRQSQKMESIGTLAGGIAHDFNNILGIIVGYASVLPDQAEDSTELHRSVDAILRAAERGTTVVRQMLTFARKTTVHFEAVNLNAIARELEHMLEHSFPRTITFSLELDQHVPSIMGDHNQIHQAMLNLCVNAKDAMQGSGVITIRTLTSAGSALRSRFPSATADRYVCIAISDTGTGIDENVRSRIFEPFFTTKEPGKGTGLGLAVVYGILHNHHGFIDLASPQNSGAIFSLYFPINPGARERSLTAGTEATQVNGGSETLLVVEDEELLLKLLTRTLEGKGYIVLTARDGSEALEVYNAHKETISLVLTDMGLPRLNGREVFRTMRSINPSIKVVIASGYLDPGFHADMLKEGVREFIQKPYAPHDLLVKIRRILDDPSY